MSPKNTKSKKSGSVSRAKAPATKKTANSQPKGRLTAAKKGASAKVAGKVVGKAAVKKTTAKNPTAKKSAVKKTAAKKPTAAKPTTKKKVAVKKVAVSRPVAKKTTKKPAAVHSANSQPTGKSAVKSSAKSAKPTQPVAKTTVAATRKPTPAKKAGTTTIASRPLKKATASVGGDYAKFRDLLLTLRHRLVGDVSMMSREALGGSDGAADNHAPIHPAEVGTHSFEQEFTLNLLSSDGDRLDRIDAALEKIAEGTYGACDECGGRIPRARLEVIPDTPYCVKCATRLEV